MFNLLLNKLKRAHNVEIVRQIPSPTDLFLDALTGASLFNSYYSDYIRSLAKKEKDEPKGVTLKVMRGSHAKNSGGVLLKVVRRKL